jgi:hypothetical protein
MKQVLCHLPRYISRDFKPRPSEERLAVESAATHTATAVLLVAATHTIIAVLLVTYLLFSFAPISRDFSLTSILIVLAVKYVGRSHKAIS